MISRLLTTIIRRLLNMTLSVIYKSINICTYHNNYLYINEKGIPKLQMSRQEIQYNLTSMQTETDVCVP